MDSKPFVTGCLKIYSSLLLNRQGGVLVPGVKRLGVKLTTQFYLAKVKNEWRNASTPPMFLGREKRRRYL